jgi:hypothetical protein
MFRKSLEARLQQLLSVLATWLSVAIPLPLETECSNATPDHLSDDDDPPFGPFTLDPDE